MSQNTGDPNKTSSVKAALPADDVDLDETPIVVTASAPAAEPAAASGDGASRAQDILAKIRARQQS